jgi:hypothetical protein
MYQDETNFLLFPFAVLHPRHKATYFTNAKWPREWITTAERILRDEWSSNYKPKDVPVENPVVIVSVSQRCLT